jgi:hypothetical protein
MFKHSLFIKYIISKLNLYEVYLKQNKDNSLYSSTGCRGLVVVLSFSKQKVVSSSQNIAKHFVLSFEITHRDSWHTTFEIRPTS